MHIILWVNVLIWTVGALAVLLGRGHRPTNESSAVYARVENQINWRYDR
jgi:hypothetical protein